MKKQALRSEIDINDTWDLTKIYKDEASWQKDYDSLKNEMQDYKKYVGKIANSKNEFKDFLQFDTNINRKLYKLYDYAHLSFDCDTTNTLGQTLQGKMDELLQENSVLTSFIRPELLSYDFDIIKKYIDEDKELETYFHTLDNIFRYKSHRMSKEQEEICAMYSNVLSSPSDVYEALTDSDLKFGNIINEDGEEEEFTESKWGVFCKSKDRNVRLNAFNMLYETYRGYANTLTKIYSKYVEERTINAKLNNFKNALECSLFSDGINVEVYDNLIKTINDNLKVNHRYYDLKKKVLKLDELHLYDVYAPLVENYSKKYTFEEAKELVIEALLPLGKNYVEDLKQAFTQRWIDIYNNKGKRGGAYSGGSYDTYPYVLLNYEGTFNDVSTLAHELGHSMHTYYSIKNNDFVNYNYKIFVAEVASTVNELLLRMHLLNKSTDKNERLFIINSLLELYRTTIYRQTMFAEFEKESFNMKENGEILTNENLCNLYLKLNEKYFGKNVVVDELIKYEWMRVPHFYYNFYVYKYSIGLSCATYIVENILNKKEGAVENYLKFLSSGNSDYPAEVLKIAGIDVSKPEVISSATQMFDKLITEFEKELGEK